VFLRAMPVEPPNIPLGRAMRHFKKIDWSISLTMLFACVLTVAAACVESSGPLGAPNVLYVGPVSSVQITLAQPTLAPGQVTQATVVAKSADGEVVSGHVDYSSGNPSIATASSTGRITAISAGTAAIQATVAGHAATTALTVQALDPPAVGPLDLVSHNFDDNTLGPYADAGGADLSIVDDPTGSGKGKVVRLHYVGVNQDRNRSIAYQPAFANAIGLGQTIYSRGEFYLQANIDTDVFIGRKLLYFWNNHAPNGFPEFSSVVTLAGTELKWWGTVVTQNGMAQITGSGVLKTLTPGRWYTLETQHTLNSSFATKDGIFRLWLDGELIFEKTGYSWSDPNWTASPADQRMLYLWVGQQVNFNTGSYDEYRYWDNVAFSSKRIGL
jgi:hypothetical protein